MEDPKQSLTDEERHYYALNRKVWPWLAPAYDSFTFPLRRLRQKAVEAAGVAPGARVLDVATGTGEQAVAFAASASEVVGIDISEAMLRIARRKPHPLRVTFQLADATKLPFDNATFDACSVSFGLHEMPRTVRERAVAEMVRVTKPGGRIVVVDYALPPNRLASGIVYRLVKLYERDNYAEFVRSDLHALLANAGVAVESDWRLLGKTARIVVGRKLEDVPARQPKRADGGQFSRSVS